MTSPFVRARPLRELLDNDELPPEEQDQYRQLIGAMARLMAEWTWTDAEVRIFGRPGEPPPAVVHRPL